MPRCPKCQQTKMQHKAGKTGSYAQRYLCKNCGCKYTPQPKPRGYPPEMRQQAVLLFNKGMKLRCVGRHLGVHHRTVSLWVKAYSDNLPKGSLPEEVK